jgi:methylenetetrahydrofolate dehydrogenase (NADP+)/methenyltetrahydrofolate cyclohydrolase/formyltetrahydrofolate synthetase
VQTAAREAGAFAAVVSNHWAEGGAGALQLAEAVVAASKTESHFRFLYDLEVFLRL